MSSKSLGSETPALSWQTVRDVGKDRPAAQHVHVFFAKVRLAAWHSLMQEWKNRSTRVGRIQALRVRRSFWWHRSMASMLFGSTVVNLRRLLGQRQGQQGLDAFKWFSIKPCLHVGCWLPMTAVSIAAGLAAPTCQVDSSWGFVMSSVAIDGHVRQFPSALLVLLSFSRLHQTHQMLPRGTASRFINIVRRKRSQGSTDGFLDSMHWEIG